MSNFTGHLMYCSYLTGQTTETQTSKAQPHFIVLCFIVLHRHCVFYKLKFCAALHEQVCKQQLSNSICSLPISMSHFGNSHNIFNFSILSYLLIL